MLTVHENYSVKPGSLPDKVTSKIFVTVDRNSSIIAFYSMEYSSVRPERIIYEARWSRADNGTYISRDWIGCDLDKGRPPADMPKSRTALLTEMLGPQEPPAHAKIVSKKPFTWEIDRGMGRIQVTEHGPGWFSRTIRSGTGKRFTSTVSGVTESPAHSIPEWRRGWAGCKSDRAG
ncbi:hypothetical protein ACFQHO_53665 [Actinomadura yumaensis]|uniref:hypothetical protein n=1 Tax=Actinomadura yumaensis TaxID=111807 RepID=UPI00361F17F0